MVDHLNWFSTLIEWSSERERPRQEYMVGIKGGRRCVVTKRLSTERKIFQAYQHLG